jgi:hypothetical protein
MLFREGKWRLCVEVTGDESCFFYLQYGRNQDNARVKMQNQGLAVANLRQKSWFAFDLSQDAQSLFTF